VSLSIVGLGTAVPTGRVSQEDAAEHAVKTWGEAHNRAKAIPMLYRLSGVKTRHSVLVESSTNGSPARQSFYQIAENNEDFGPTTGARMLHYEAGALSLAREASQQALTDASVSGAEVTHLITVSCSGFRAPGFDLGLVEELGLPRSVVRTHVGFMGCHGAFNALRVADAFLAAEPGATVLICCLEICSIHQQYTADADQIVANALFSDGAAAVVCRRTGPEMNSWRLEGQASYIVPKTAEFMGWQIGDHGFQMSLSPQVPEVIQRELRPYLARWLAGHGLDVKEIGAWAIHPGGPRILLACSQGLGLQRDALDASREVLSAYGNMSSPTILFILDHLRRERAAGPCVGLAFGPGLTIEAAIFSVSDVSHAGDNR
jgi:predicted naringenin-chalcone synthase